MSIEAKADDVFMSEALLCAQRAALEGEVPVGALVIQTHSLDGEKLNQPIKLAHTYNNRESARNPFGHAEFLALQMASEKLGRWRLIGCTLYVTLEPCLMCAGAIVLSRVDRVVYGAVDSKAGAVESLYQVLNDERLNHRPEVRGGCLKSQCSGVLSHFFSERRKEKEAHG